MNAAACDAVIDAAAARLRAGGLVVFPTETVYGLGADALNEAAVARVFAAKGRPPENPLIVHVADEAMARGIVSDWPPGASDLVRAFWPGPLTLVVGRSATVPAIVTGGGETVALRCPDHPVALALIRAFGGPIVGPSANRSGSISPTSAGRVRAVFGEDEVMVLDGGPCRGGIESTVVSLARRPARVLRLGAVSAGEIARVLGEPVEVGGGEREASGALASPGMLARHYAPRTAAELFDAERWPGVVDEGPGPVVVLTHARARTVVPPNRLIRMPMDAPGYAARLYEALHEADDAGAARVVIEKPTGEGALWDAVRDRLVRATTPQ